MNTRLAILTLSMSFNFATANATSKMVVTSVLPSPGCTSLFNPIQNFKDSELDSAEAAMLLGKRVTIVESRAALSTRAYRGVVVSPPRRQAGGLLEIKLALDNGGRYTYEYHPNMSPTYTLESVAVNGVLFEADAFKAKMLSAGLAEGRTTVLLHFEALASRLFDVGKSEVTYVEYRPQTGDFQMNAGRVTRFPDVNELLALMKNGSGAPIEFTDAKGVVTSIDAANIATFFYLPKK